ncbi:MAG: hypothetical protein MJ230_05400 [bacterium]|nr:hypothetical protein [bacterium]
MTDEMTVNQRPSAMPYLLGGAAVGGAGGYALSNYANVGIKTGYKSWEDAVADVTKDDSFCKKQIEKKGDNVDAWEELQKQSEAVKNAQKAVDDAAGAAKDTEELTKYMEKLNEVETKENETLEKLLKGETKIGKDENAKTFLNSYEKSNDLLNEFKNVNGIKDKEFKIGESNVKGENLKLEQAKERPEFKEWAAKQEKFIDAAKETDEYKKIRESANKELSELENAVKSKNEKLNVNEFKEALRKYTEAKNEAGKALTEDVLKKCKKPNNWLTAAVGAGVLALGALALRPKAEA